VSISHINDRAQYLLKVLVEHYVIDGRPVGSRCLARDAGLDVSPATIRNVMADLEEAGLVVSPHTSAGRIPTEQGFRFFVDSLLTVAPLQDAEIRDLRSGLDAEATTKELIGQASDVLSEVTRMAGLVMVPRLAGNTFKQIEFMPMSGNRVLAILVYSDKEVQNRVIHTQRTYTPSELQQAANYLTQACHGQDASVLRERILTEMQEARDSMSSMMQATIEMADKILDDTPEEGDFVLAGQTNLMGIQELSDVEKLKSLFEAFNQKRDILHLLDQSIHAQGIQIFIGHESGCKAFDGCSLITSSYEMDGQAAGVLGVIGPTRMNYERVIPIVDITAKLLSAALNQRN